MVTKLGENLILNEGAEQGNGDPIGNAVGTAIPPLPGWTTNGGFSVLRYGATGFEFVNLRGQTVRVSGLPDANSPGPLDRGQNLFYGGAERGSSSASQLINLSDIASGIDSRRGLFELSGWLGGYQDQLDSPSLNITFLDQNNQSLGNASINAPTAAQRNNQTGLFLQSADGAVPVGTRQVSVALNMNYTSGRVNDAYADNLSLVVTAVPELKFGKPSSDNGIASPAIELPSSPSSFPNIVFSGAGSDLIDAIPSGSLASDRLYAGTGNDEIVVGTSDRAFGDAGNDIIDASAGGGSNRSYGGDGNDELIAGSNDRLLGGNGNDTLDSSLGGNNRLYGGVGNDIFFLGNSDRAIGAEGDDQFFVGTGGGNTITGGQGADQFWVVANGLPQGSNTVTDLEVSDVIGIGGYTRADLSFREVNGSGVLTVAGVDVATFAGVNLTTLQSANIVFA